MKIDVIKATYLDSKHEKEIQELLTVYAIDPMGEGKSLDKKFGFFSYALDPKTGVALFWQKKTTGSKN